MSGQLADIESRIAATRQLDSVVGAMRGIAAARSAEALARLPGIRGCARTVGEAIGAVLAGTATLPVQDEDEAKRAASVVILIVLCTEQGFVGGFNVQTIERAAMVERQRPREVLLVGSRGAPAAAQRGLEVVWSAPAAAHVGDVDALAAALTDALYGRLALRPGAVVRVVHARPDAAQRIEIVDRQLLPFDFSRFGRHRGLAAPRVQLPVPRLLAGLVEAWVFVALSEALMVSSAAENEARIQAMLAARSHVRARLDTLVGEFRQRRQEEITSEIVELAAGAQMRE